jgi:AcrR family transcriptional regulator
MPAPIRVCRALFEAEHGPPEMNRRQKEREKRVLAAAEMLMVQFGRAGVSFRTLAGTLRIARTTLAWHYADLDALLGQILRTYLQALHVVLGEVPRDAENRQILLRAAYLNAIQGPFGQLTPLHKLLTRDRHALPADELESIERILRGLGELLAGDLGPIAMDLLERPWMDADMAEALLATIAAKHAAQAAEAAAEPPALALVEPPPPEPARPEPPAPTGFRYFDIQDIPLPAPGSLAAMTDKELARAARPPPNRKTRRNR